MPTAAVYWRPRQVLRWCRTVVPDLGSAVLIDAHRCTAEQGDFLIRHGDTPASALERGTRYQLGNNEEEAGKQQSSTT